MFSGLVQRVKSFPDLTRSDSENNMLGKVTESEMKRVGSNPEMDPEVEPNKNIAWIRGEALLAFYVGVLVFFRVLASLLNLSPHTAWTAINVGHCIVSESACVICASALFISDTIYATITRSPSPFSIG